MIPHIIKSNGVWLCFTDQVSAMGINPSEAYIAWRQARIDWYTDRIYRTGRG